MEAEAAAAWRERFGTEAPAEARLVASFLAHRSVRAFLAEPVPDGLAAALVGAAQSASTSSHLQAWSVVSVDEPARRAEIAELCAGQRQIIEAARFFAFVADFRRIAQANEETPDSPDAVGCAELFTVAAVDAALAAERMACAAESVGLGVCYIGALRNDPAGVSRLLGLPSKTIGLFGLCLGWPDPGRPAAIKPRLSPGAVWHREAYRDAPVEEFDGRMAVFYASQGMNPEVPWSRRSGRRCTVGGIGTRVAWGDRLRDQGLLVGPS